MDRVIAIVDYGAGNLRSIDNALRKVCADSDSPLRPVVSTDPDVIARAAGVVLPGVGAAGPTMRRLQQAGLVGPIRDAATGKPFLGICLGMQLLFGYQEEGGVDGLGVLEGSVERLPGGVKLPHIGWNRVRTSAHRMFRGIDQDAYFYFVHSYRAQPAEECQVLGTTYYGEPFCAAITRDNLWAAQFHPEKSGETGLRLLRNFVEMVEMQERA
jgi:glutamine amidotransferase